MRVRFVCSNDVRQTVLVEEVVDSSGSEADGASASGTFTEAIRAQSRFHGLGSGVGPEAVGGHLLHPLGFVAVRGHHSNHVGHVENSLQLAVETVDRSWDSSVTAEYFVVNNSREGQSVEHLVALLPYIFANLFAKAFYLISN